MDAGMADGEVNSPAPAEGWAPTLGVDALSQR